MNPHRLLVTFFLLGKRALQNCDIFKINWLGKKEWLEVLISQVKTFKTKNKFYVF